MSDFERVDAFFGDTPLEYQHSENYREVKIDLGSAAVYWAAIDLNHPNPSETLRSIPVEVSRGLTVYHSRYPSGFRGKRFVDVLSVGQDMGGEGMFYPDALDDAESVAIFRQRHDVNPGSILKYMGMSPVEPDVVSGFTFDSNGHICATSSDKVEKTRFNKVMDYLEMKKIKSSVAKI